MPRTHLQPRTRSGRLTDLGNLSIIFLALFLLAATSALGQSPFEDDEEIPDVVVTFESRIEPAVARPGEHARLIVTATVHDGWYIYSLQPPEDEFAPPPTKFTVSPNGLVVLGIPYEVNPIIKRDQVFDMTLAFHKKAARFYQNLQVPEQHAIGETTIEGAVRYQTCNDRICLPAKTDVIVAVLNVEDGPVRPPFAFMQRTVDYLDGGTFRLNADSLEEAMSQGLGAFLLLAVVFGLLALLTPCVFPMIPITVSFFTAVANERGGGTLRLALLFAVGIVVTYTGLGLALTFFFGAAGTSQFATNPWVNLVVAGFFIVFALSLMGVFQIALPAALVNRLDQKARGIKGPAGVIIMGLAFTATSFTCTVQFVGTLLIAAFGGEIFRPVLGMIVLSTVFALPFFLLALFPQYVMAIRGKSGAWLTQVKVVLGILELLAALKFVSNADLYWQWGFFDRSLLLYAAAALAGLSALVILGIIPWPGVGERRMSLPRLAWGGAMVLGAVYFFAGVQGAELDAYTEAYLPPPLEHDRAARGSGDGEFLEVSSLHDLPWHPTLEPALAQAAATGRPVFVDFTGYTCINCRWMEKKVFAEKNVFQAFRERFVLAQLYTDGGEFSEQNQQLQIERFRTLALPYYVILSPDNAVLAKHAGIMPSPTDFLAWLAQGERQLITAARVDE